MPPPAQPVRRAESEGIERAQARLVELGGARRARRIPASARRCSSWPGRGPAFNHATLPALVGRRLARPAPRSWPSDWPCRRRSAMPRRLRRPRHARRTWPRASSRRAGSTSATRSSCGRVERRPCPHLDGRAAARGGDRCRASTSTKRSSADIFGISEREADDRREALAPPSPAARCASTWCAKPVCPVATARLLVEDGLARDPRARRRARAAAARPGRLPDDHRHPRRPGARCIARVAVGRSREHGRSCALRGPRLSARLRLAALPVGRLSVEPATRRRSSQIGTAADRAAQGAGHRARRRRAGWSANARAPRSSTRVASSRRAGELVDEPRGVRRAGASPASSPGEPGRPRTRRRTRTSRDATSGRGGGPSAARGIAGQRRRGGSRPTLDGAARMRSIAGGLLDDSRWPRRPRLSRAAQMSTPRVAASRSAMTSTAAARRSSASRSGRFQRPSAASGHSTAPAQDAVVARPARLVADGHDRQRHRVRIGQHIADGRQRPARADRSVSWSATPGTGRGRACGGRTARRRWPPA